jgi:stage V sporulation protein SpoVS
MAAVISVAIKAIAVAKDYVINEGPLYQVAFQPYIRHQASAIPGLRYGR